jgi:ketosteroid isomerase-like protein
MYHRIVASRVRNVFAEINAGNWEAMISGMADRFTYRFYGHSPLSGERHTAAALRMWWQRMDILLPNPTFTVEEVIVAGPPWSTRIATRVTVRATLPDGSPYENLFMQQISMRWGRITQVHTLEDTATLQHALDALAAAGIKEAHAAPITDEMASTVGV